MSRSKRTRAQQYADYDKTFPHKTNDRRCDLIVKKYDGEGLAEEEERELEECTRTVDEWGKRSPRTKDLNAKLDKEMAELESLLAKHGLTTGTALPEDHNS